MDVIKPISGKYKWNNSADLNYFKQEEEFKDDVNAINYLRYFYHLKTDGELRSILALAGIKGELALRPIKTLSGGEQFKASLSLALGLADEIQASAGGVKLDTMFVDEGFGSLDDESLDQAMKALSSLADGNRLVGIISHVNELKNRIDKQIVVKKERCNGSNVTIVV